MDPISAIFVMVVLTGAFAKGVDVATDGLLSAEIGGGVRGVRGYAVRAGRARWRLANAKAREIRAQSWQGRAVQEFLDLAGMFVRVLSGEAVRFGSGVRSGWETGREQARSARTERRGDAPWPVTEWLHAQLVRLQEARTKTPYEPGMDPNGDPNEPRANDPNGDPNDPWQDPSVAGGICEAVNAYDPDDDKGVAETVTAQRAASPGCTYCGELPVVATNYRGERACTAHKRWLPAEPKRWTPPENRCAAMVERQFPKYAPGLADGLGDRIGEETRAVRCSKEAANDSVYCAEHRNAPGPLTGGGCRAVVPVDTPGRRILIRHGMRSEDDQLVDAPCPNQAGLDGYCDDHRLQSGDPNVPLENTVPNQNGDVRCGCCAQLHKPLEPGEHCPNCHIHDPTITPTGPIPNAPATKGTSMDVNSAPAAIAAAEAFQGRFESLQSRADALAGEWDSLKNEADTLHGEIATAMDGMGDFAIGGEADTAASVGELSDAATSAKERADSVVTSIATAKERMDAYIDNQHLEFDASIEAAAGKGADAHAVMQEA